MSSPVFFAARMPAKRAEASTLPLAMVCAWISLRVPGCRRISPRAMASRNMTGFAETSTIVASPLVSMWVSFFITAGIDDHGSMFGYRFLPFFDHRAHLFGSIQLRFHVLETKPRKHAE